MIKNKPYHGAIGLRATANAADPKTSHIRGERGHCATAKAARRDRALGPTPLLLGSLWPPGKRFANGGENTARTFSVWSSTATGRAGSCWDGRHWGNRPRLGCVSVLAVLNGRRWAGWQWRSRPTWVGRQSRPVSDALVFIAPGFTKSTQDPDNGQPGIVWSLGLSLRLSTGQIQ